MENDVNFDKYRVAITMIQNYTVNRDGDVFSRPDYSKEIVISELPTLPLHPSWPKLSEQLEKFFNLTPKIVKPYSIIEMPFSSQEIECLYEGISIQWFMPGENNSGFTLNIHPKGGPVFLRHLTYKEPYLVFLVDLSTNSFDSGSNIRLN